MEILVNVRNQKMKIATNIKSLVSGTQEFIRFKFNFSDDWQDLKTFAQFTQNGIPYNVYLDDDKCAYLPNEIKEGVCTIMLYGNNGTIIGLTNYITICLDKNILITGASSTEITQTLYDQLIEKVNQLQKTYDDSQLVNYVKKTDLAAVATSGDYEDLENTPTFPTALKNPNALIINGVSYDGSKPVTLTIEGGGGGTIDDSDLDVITEDEIDAMFEKIDVVDDDGKVVSSHTIITNAEVDEMFD